MWVMTHPYGMTEQQGHTPVAADPFRCNIASHWNCKSTATALFRSHPQPDSPRSVIEDSLFGETKLNKVWSVQMTWKQ